MKKRICFIFFLLFFINISFVFSGHLTPGLEKLSKEIKSLTYSNKYDSAQALVIEFLNQKNLTELEIFYGHYLFGDVLKSSLKSVEAVEQLLKSKNYLKKIQKKEKYESLVNAKIAEAYFDVLNFTEAKKYAQLSIQLNPDASLRSGGHAVNYIILGYSEYVAERYSPALNLYNMAIEELLKKNELCELPLCYIKLAKVYNALKKYPETEENINKAIFISDSCGIKNYKLLALHATFDIYKDNKNYKKALETLEKINDFVGDMHFDIQQSLMSELEIKYETKLAQNENNNLKQINLKNEEILVRQKSALIITISAVLILSVLLFLIFKISGQRKKAEERLQAVNKELEAFSYSVSHDLRAPLRNIQGNIRILSEDYISKTDDESQKLMELILSNAKKMGELIDELLVFAQIEKKELVLTKVSMHDMVTGVCDELKKQEGSRDIKFNIKDLPPVKADTSSMKQVWLNLISNSLKYTKLKKKAVIEIGSEAKGHEVTYYIRDNGAGFDMQYAGKLFGVFQRLHLQEEFEGTGVGLAIVQRVIAKHGGKVWAEGKVNEGAIFKFSLN